MQKLLLFDKDTAWMAFINFLEVWNAYVANIQFLVFVKKDLFITVHVFSSTSG